MADVTSWQRGFQDALVLFEREFPAVARDKRFAKLKDNLESRRACELRVWLGLNE